MAVNYKLVESEGEGYHSDHWAIQILEGECEGLTYQYDTVQFNEVDGQGVLDFQTISIENPKENDLTSESVVGIMGDILIDIIETQLREIENGDGNTDTEAPAE